MFTDNFYYQIFEDSFSDYVNFQIVCGTSTMGYGVEYRAWSDHNRQATNDDDLLG